MAAHTDKAGQRLCGLNPSCLRQALAMRLVTGGRMPLYIGVRRGMTGELQAHTWVNPSTPEAEESVEIATL